MTEHLSFQQIERYGRRTLPAAELIFVDRHLNGCETCYRRFAGMHSPLPDKHRPLDLDLSRPPDEEPFHLLYVEHLIPYADDKVDEIDREIIESHLEVCGQCADDLSDLREFIEKLNHPAQGDRAPAGPPTLRERMPAFRTRLAQWNQSPLAVITSIAVVVVSAAVLFIATRDSERPVPVAQSEQPSAGVVEQSSIEPDTPTASPPETHITPTPQSADERRGGELTRPNGNAHASLGVAKGKVQRRILVALNDGGQRVELDGEGNLTGLSSLPRPYRLSVVNALTTQRLEAPSSLAALIRRGTGLRGAFGSSGSFLPRRLEDGPVAPPALSPLSPVDTVVRTDRPTFRWQQLDGAASYTVNLYDSRFNKVDASPPLSNTEWTPLMSLERGGVYTWQVVVAKEIRETVSAAGRTPAAKFKVMEQSNINKLERVEKAVRNSPLAKGVVYTQFGLLDEAETQFRVLLDSNPKSAVAQNFLDSLRTLRRPQQ